MTQDTTKDTTNEEKLKSSLNNYDCEKDAYTIEKERRALENGYKLRKLRRDKDDDRRRSKWGRPYNPRKKLLTRSVCFEATQEDYAVLAKLAAERKTTLSSFLRSQLNLRIQDIYQDLMINGTINDKKVEGD